MKGKQRVGRHLEGTSQCRDLIGSPLLPGVGLFRAARNVGGGRSSVIRSESAHVSLCPAGLKLMNRFPCGTLTETHNK